MAFRIVSCSAFQAYKRVDLIIDILSKLKENVEWVHFGDGELKEEILRAVVNLPPNIKFTWMGFKDNDFIMQYYKNNFVDLFVNVSSTEGIPVSIMEAISFGIPAVATNVGGVSEIVNSQTGFLIEKFFDSFEVANIISSYLNSSIEIKNKIRMKAKLFWEENYNAKINHHILFSELVK